MSEQVQQQKEKYNPTNQIDLQVMTTEPYISSNYMSDRIRNKFRDFAYERDEEGKVVYDEEGKPKLVITKDIWSNIELFTQDIRLANFSVRELNYVRVHLDLCSDILTVFPSVFNKPAFICLERSVSVVETSQGKQGMLRNLFNTFFHNQSIKEDQPAQRSFFGLGKKKGGNQ